MSKRKFTSFDVEGALYEGKPISYWAERLDSGEYIGKEKALEALAALGPDALPALLQIIQRTLSSTCETGEVTAQLDAATLIAKLGPATIPPLIEIVRNSEPGDVFLAAIALDDIGTEAVTALLELLRDPDPKVMAAAINALAPMAASRESEHSDTLIPILLEYLDHADASVRDVAFWKLAALDPTLEGVRGRLTLELASDDRDVAAFHLGPFAGSEIEPLVREWIDTMGRPFIKYTRPPNYYLIDLGGRAVPFLIEALESSNPDLRRRAAKCLRSIQECYRLNSAPPTPAQSARFIAHDRAYVDSVRPYLAQISSAFSKMRGDENRFDKATVTALGFGSLDGIPSEDLPQHLDALRDFSAKDFARALIDLLTSGNDAHIAMAIQRWPDLKFDRKRVVLQRLFRKVHNENDFDVAPIIAGFKSIGYESEDLGVALGLAAQAESDPHALANEVFRKLEGLSQRMFPGPFRWAFRLFVHRFIRRH